MHLEYTPEQQRLRTELRTCFAALVPDNAYARYAGPAARKRFYRDTVRRLGADGWLGVDWPKEYGGRGLTPMEQFIFFDEAAQAGVPLPLMALNTVGPTVMHYGTDEQKAHFLPGILAGEIDFAIGCSEPDAGTDLAALKTRAVREGDTCVVNGQKIWTTNGDTADWVWLAVRTDPDAPPHKGITMLLVPTSDPGYSCTLINTLASHDTTAGHYEDIRVPVSRRVGEENKGWRLITNQLNHERVTLAAHGTMAVRALHDVQRWAADTDLADGRRVIDLGWVRAPDATLAVFAGVHAVRAVDPSGATLWEVRHGCWNSGCEEIHDAYAYADRRDHRFPGSGSVGCSADGSLVRAHVRGPLPEGELS